MSQDAFVLSIVTPTYNRENLICRSLDASLQLVRSGVAGEIVVVDDASTDNTVTMLRERYHQEIAENILIIDCLSVNQGVTAAKNRGAALARGCWIAFMDSDDNFIVEQAKAMYDSLMQHQDHDALFFRCRDQQTNEMIGKETNATDISLSQLLNGGTPGECLPVVKRQTMLRHPYPAQLRGSEGLTYLKILHCGGRIHLSELVVREYENHAVDRLSSRQGLRKRAGTLCLHNVYMLAYLRHAGLKTALGWFARIGYYGFWFFISKLKGRPV